jgi:hypothetical protein
MEEAIMFMKKRPDASDEGPFPKRIFPEEVFPQEIFPWMAPDGEHGEEGTGNSHGKDDEE